MKNVMRKSVMRKTGLILFGLMFLACGGGPAPAPTPASPADELDAGIRETSNYLNKQITKGNKVVILNIQSDFPALSEYIIDDLIANSVNDDVFAVVDRQQLNTIRAELDFQMSGEVDDKTAQALGRMAGAQIIVSGAVSKVGDLYRLRVRALGVQSAEIEGQFNRNIPAGSTIAALTRSQATGYGGGSSGGTAAAKAQAGSAPVGQTAKTPAPGTAPAGPSAQSPAPAPKGPVYDKAYKIGDTGPAGGIVFYDKGSASGGWRYLEAAPPETEFKTAWGEAGETVGGTSPGIGKGKDNTQILIQYLKKNKGKTGITAQACAELEFGGCQDWFWPSSGELNLMYKNLKEKELGEFSNQWYWSSSESAQSSAWAQNFKNGEQSDAYRSWIPDGVGAKITTNLVRAIRAF